jgi:hypothetical protein
MPQKKKVIKKVKVSKNQPLLKDSINIKIDLDDDIKKKPKRKGTQVHPIRKKRNRKSATETAADNNDVSYVDEVGQPVGKETINQSFNSTYPQPFSRNSTVIRTSFNESAVMDKVMEKMSRLKTSSNSFLNQSTNNNTALNQSGAAPPRLPKPAPPQFPGPALSSIVPASPSVAPQSLNLKLSSLVKPVGLSPLQASSLAMNRVQQYTMSSAKAASISQEELNKIFFNVRDIDQAEIKRATMQVKDSHFEDINKGTTLGGQAKIFKKYFRDEYKGQMDKKETSPIAWQYYKMLP